ncbi:MAG: hypothetical protein PVG33_18450 [Chloroflexota bacterium]|jgi:hypothetical protein
MESERDELESATIEDELANLETLLGSREETADEAGEAAASSQFAADADVLNLSLEDLDVAERVAVLSEAMAKAGVTDLLEGAEMLAASEDIAAQSAVIGLLDDEDLADAMDIAAISGQLFAISELLEAVAMPVLAAFLEAKGEELHDIAVDAIFRYNASRAVREAMADTSADLGAMGEQEIAEGAVGLEAAGQLADQDDEPADDVDVAQEQYESVEEGLAEDQDQES